MRSSLLFSSLCLPLFGYAAPQKKAADPTVSIASGTIVGTATAVSNQPSVTGLANAYLGVPYAKSPPLRFAPPEAPAAWSTPLKAQQLPPACLQQFLPGSDGEREREYFNNPGLSPPAESEDCMYLNVFAPQDASPTNLKAVMFWVFGGNLQIGTASLAYYNGSSLAVNHDVVVVAINYRTNMFGFSNSPEIAAGKQNSGFLDQRFALQWVQDNIKHFGGDPTKVTIFGESAGGYSIKQLLANPPNPLPFRAAIMESQQALRAGNGLVSYNQVAANFGCALALSPLACLRKVSGTAIQQYISNNSVDFPPVTNDGTDSGSQTLPAIESGKFADVPILIGTNKDEFTVFLAILGLNPQVSGVSSAAQAIAPALSNQVITALTSTYPQSVVDDADALLSRIITDFIFTCTTSTFSSAIASAGRQPVWRYRYDASFANLQFFPNAGAYHSSEIPLVYGTYLNNQNGPVTQDEVQLSMYMQNAWASFAKDPSGGPGWPRLGSNNGVELGVLGGTNKTNGESTQNLLVADYPCVVLDPILIASGEAY
ncbi:liver carboxylesterase 1 precursor [Lecanosticta acicola]|uniref:Carboxylic ester hydrolase n=1 Tax=Lecanosticta acicola TaxID=111012 RepID=A0AAI9E4U8_9PEZI|nr:liver carboxylesterase 1 precursor [Lecanosticta acicola]